MFGSIWPILLLKCANFRANYFQTTWKSSISTMSTPPLPLNGLLKTFSFSFSAPYDLLSLVFKWRTMQKLSAPRFFFQLNLYFFGRFFWRFLFGHCWLRFCCFWSGRIWIWIEGGSEERKRFRLELHLVIAPFVTVENLKHVVFPWAANFTRKKANRTMSEVV